MSNWYNKYLTIYGKSFKDIPNDVLDTIKDQLARKQCADPLVSVVVIAYNEEKRLAACLWSLSELQTVFPIEILGVNNNSLAIILVFLGISTIFSSGNLNNCVSLLIISSLLSSI